MALGPDHLAERLAARLGGVGGLGAAADSSNGTGPGAGTRSASASASGGRARRVIADPLPLPPSVDDAVPPVALDVDTAVVAAAGSSTAPAQGWSAGEDLPPPPASFGAEAAGADEIPVALVLERLAPLPSRSRDELAPVPGVNLDTMVPAPVTLDLVSLERAGLVVGRKARTRISEEFRVSVGQILRSVRGSYTPGRGAGNLVMVTSARPGEGKSFTALNLAGSIAQHTQREVLLVDIDAKQNALSDQLGIGDRPGLIDLALTPSLRVEDTIVRTVIANLSVLPVGLRRLDSLEGGAEGTVARPITALIERLGRRYANHIIILDAPPCLSTSDPSTIAPLVGQIVMVVEAERTQRSEVLAALDLIKACPTITLMLNKIQVTTSYTFGAYHYFGSYS